MSARIRRLLPSPHSSQPMPSTLLDRVFVIVSALEPLASMFYVERDRSHPMLVQENLSNFSIGNEPLILLRELYYSLNDAGKSQLLSIISDAVFRSWPTPLTVHSPMFVTFLAKYQGSISAVDALCGGFRPDNVGEAALIALSNILCFDHTTFSDEELYFIPEKVTRAIEASVAPEAKAFPGGDIMWAPPGYLGYSAAKKVGERIEQQCLRVRYLRERKLLLEKANFEINQDRDELLDTFQRLGFSQKLGAALKNVETEYLKADSEFHFKTCSDHLRSFFEALLRETYARVAKVKGGQAKSEQPVHIREYLEQAAFFSKRLKDLVSSFYGFASEESTHKLDTPREVARLSRSMGIELGLLIVKRVQKFGPP